MGFREQARDAQGRFTTAGNSQNFGEQMRAFAQKAIALANGMVQTVALEGYGHLLRRSPVDSGVFRGNWRVGVNSPDTTFSATDKSGAAAGSDPTTSELARVAGAIDGVKVGDTVHITNATPYAGDLEDGWSGQAPQGMIALTADDLKATITARIAEMQRGGA